MPEGLTVLENYQHVGLFNPMIKGALWWLRPLQLVSLPQWNSGDVNQSIHITSFDEKQPLLGASNHRSGLLGHGLSRFQQRWLGGPSAGRNLHKASGIPILTIWT